MNKLILYEYRCFNPYGYEQLIIPAFTQEQSEIILKEKVKNYNVWIYEGMKYQLIQNNLAPIVFSSYERI